MSPTIRITDEVYARLQQQAEPFIDTPDSVLRRLLGLPGQAPQDPTGMDVGPLPALSAQEASTIVTEARPNGAMTKASAAAPVMTSPARHRAARKRDDRAARPPRAPRGSLMRDVEYELPILQVLDQGGGRAGKNEVLDALEPLLDEKLTELDRTPLGSGEIRWRNRAQFVRLRLVQRGEMKNDSPRGIWELAELGRARLADAGAAVSTSGAQ